MVSADTCYTFGISKNCCAPGMDIQRRLANYPVPDAVWDEYHLSEEINDRGIMIDLTLVENAIRMDAQSRAELTDKMQKLTRLDNPNSVQQMKQWLFNNGMEVDSLGKKQVQELLNDAPPELSEVLLLRQQLAKSSVKKYIAMKNAVCDDGRVRGMFRFYGANRTGRWASKLINLQNLYKNSMPDLESARILVRNGDYDAVKARYSSVPDVLSELIRTAFVPSPGKKMIVADFSAIEARVIAWLAGEQWRLDLFARGGDIYCQSASQMFKVPVEKHGVNGHLRQKGKIAELACIAQGEPVLTDRGLVPIEAVRPNDRLWDGQSWVAHDGVIERGIRSVITYQGLTATIEHMVCTYECDEPIPLICAASNGLSLVITGPGYSQDCCFRYREMPVYDIVNAGPHHRFTVSGHLVHNCGYGGSVGALKAMGALDMGLQEDELAPLVKAWRESNPNIVKLWWDVDSAVMKAIRDKTTTQTHGLTFTVRSGMLFITLPSGRHLSYVKPRIGENRFGSQAATYMGAGAMRKWERIESYGPKFCENVTQAIARDILAYAMQTLRCCRIVAHVHDELIIEADPAMSVDAICEQMSRTPPWAEGLLLRADGYECDFYRKD